MPTRRVLAEALAYRRGLVAAAFRGGSPALAEGEETARPNRPLYAGIAVAVLVALGFATTASWWSTGRTGAATCPCAARCTPCPT